MAEQAAKGIVAELAQRTGVAETEVERVLEGVGFGRALDELGRSMQQDALNAVTADQLRVSMRVGQSIVAI